MSPHRISRLRLLLVGVPGYATHRYRERRRLGQGRGYALRWAVADALHAAGAIRWV